MVDGAAALELILALAILAGIVVAEDDDDARSGQRNWLVGGRQCLYGLRTSGFIIIDS